MNSRVINTVLFSSATGALCKHGIAETQTHARVRFARVILMSPYSNSATVVTTKKSRSIGEQLTATISLRARDGMIYHARSAFCVFRCRKVTPVCSGNFAITKCRNGDLVC